MMGMIGAGARNGVSEKTRTGAQTRPLTRLRTKTPKAPTKIRAKAKTPIRKVPNRSPPSSTKCRGQDSDKKGSKQKPSVVHQVQICLVCTCALGYNLSCSDCAQFPIPPGFMKKRHMPVKAYYCPSNTEAGHICGQLLGTANNCPFCVEVRRHWSSEQVQDGWTTLPLFRKCELLQLDRILYEMEVVDPSLSSTCNFIESMQAFCKDHTVENFTPQ